MSNIATNVADILYAHEWEWVDISCKCGWRNDDDGYSDHVDHVAECLLDVFKVTRR